ncbi:hypothetical protein MACH18_01250 [Phaeobacter italicus]|nr:hypothetical protein MACH18_01250 [Phaeobacter italicus]
MQQEMKRAHLMLSQQAGPHDIALFRITVKISVFLSIAGRECDIQIATKCSGQLICRSQCTVADRASGLPPKPRPHHPPARFASQFPKGMHRPIIANQRRKITIVARQNKSAEQDLTVANVVKK